MSRIHSATVNFTCLTLASVLLLPGVCYAASPANSAYLYVGWYVGQWPNLTDYIAGYSVAANGSIQPLSGFPMTSPSFGLTPVRNFIFGDDGRYIATYTRASDGSLTETSITDDYRYAQYPYGMAIYALNPDRSGQTLTTVLSCGSCDSYTIPLTIESGGQLVFQGEALPSQGAAKWRGTFYFSPDNRFAYTEFWQDGASEFQRNPNGLFTYVGPTASAPPDQNLDVGVCLPGDMASSVRTGYVAVAWWSGIYCSGGYAYELATYTEGLGGSLNLVPGTLLKPQVVENSMAFDPTGRYLAVAGCTGVNYCTGNAALQVYKLQSNGSLTPVGDMQNVTATSSFTSVQWDTAGHVYASGCCSGNGPDTSNLYIYTFDGQNLTLAPGSPHPFANLVSIAVTPKL